MKNIPLFYPNIPKNAYRNLKDVLKSRWIGQGPLVDEFEKRFANKLKLDTHPITVGSGTDALHLAYILADIKDGDEVIAPVFTCTATNIPLLYQRAKIKWADVDPNTLNVSINSVKSLITEKTKAIVCVHYGGYPCEMDQLQTLSQKYHIPIIEDAAHAIGATYHGKPIGTLSPFTIFSFQAIKALTTGDGGMLVLKDKELVDKAKRLRWFGIDRQAKSNNNWDNQINEIGYKYQMTDIAASLGLSGLEVLDDTLKKRRKMFNKYVELLKGFKDIKIVGLPYDYREHACWLFTVMVERRDDFRKMLSANGIESSPVHYRNDIYNVFGGRVNYLHNMDLVEDKYLVLPMHMHMGVSEVEYICEKIKKGW